MNIPFSTFRGTLKQLDPAYSDEPARSNAFRWAFPAFLDPLVEHVDAEVPTFQRARPRRRRFSGGLFTRTQPLPRNRYYTICLMSNGFDGGTLCRELKAYAGSIVRQRVDVYDDVNSPTEQCRKVINIAFHDPDGEIASRLVSDGVGTGIFIKQSSFSITLEYRTFDVTIENTIDLRQPETLHWFFETFRSGYGNFWRKPKGALATRCELVVATLMSPDLGGTAVTDAIGYCLRSIGASALIYPSARSDAEVIVENGVFKIALGFNLLDFHVADVVRAETNSSDCFDDEELWDEQKWQTRLEIADLSEDRDIAERYRGSWRNLGVVRAHEEFFANGGILGGREGGEWEKIEIDTVGEVIKHVRANLNKWVK
jgi:hypothetical protein